MRSDAVHRVLEAEIVAVRRRRDGGCPQVLDVGGGSGVWAVPLAATGCAVTVVDPSPNALATLQRRADEAGVADRIKAFQGDTDALAAISRDNNADLVLGHGLLEVVDDVNAAVQALVGATAPGGAVSLLVVNRYAAVLARALAGRITEALRLFQDQEGRLPGNTGDTLQRRFDTDVLRQTMEDAGLAIEVIQGHSIFTDLVPGTVLDSGTAADALIELELAAATQPPLRDVATRLHALGRVTG